MPSHTLMAMICLDYRETWGGGQREMFLLMVGALAGYLVRIEATGNLLPSMRLGLCCLLLWTSGELAPASEDSHVSASQLLLRMLQL